MNKLISVIIPVKNGEKYLPEALSGIKAQKMNVEIIVVDDASTDRTANIAEVAGCIVLHHAESRGQVAAKNTGLKVAHGEYVMFHDHDDVMRPQVLAQLYQFLEDNPQAEAVMAKVQDLVSPDIADAAVNANSIPYFGLFTGAVLMRKALFDKVGLFNENVNTGEIIELQQKMQQAGLQMHKLDIVATNRRIHDSNFGRTAQKKEYMDYAAILRQRLLQLKNSTGKINILKTF